MSKQWSGTGDEDDRTIPSHKPPTDQPAAREPQSEPTWSAPQDRAPPPPLRPEIPGVELSDEIARGGMGVVYRGVQNYLDRTVAVKVMATHLQNAEFESRFQREAKIVAGITHTHIVSCYHAGITDDGLCFMVMEFIDGPTLRRQTDEHGPLSVPDAMRLCRDLARALDHAHRAGIIHRDVKPDNVLLQHKPNSGDTGDAGAFPFVPKLVDLGIARTADMSDGLTAPGVVMGTSSTMAPEQFDDADGVDFRADIYGLGCVIHHALTGKPAFPTATLTETIKCKQAELGPDPRKHRPDIPEPVADLVRRMLACSRDDRPASYTTITEHCQTALGSQATMLSGGATSAAAARAEPVSDSPSRTRWVLVAIVVAGLAAGGWWLASRDAGTEPGSGSENTGGDVNPPPNRPPTLTVTAPAVAREGDSIDLKATVVDPDGDTLTVIWKQVSGFPVQLSDAGRAHATVQLDAAVPGTALVFAATVSDGTHELPPEEAIVAIEPTGALLCDASLTGWRQSESTEPIPFNDYGDDTINGRFLAGEAQLERDLPADGFVLTGAVELKKKAWDTEDLTDAAGVVLRFGDGTPLVLWLQPHEDGVRAAVGTRSSPQTWPPDAMQSEGAMALDWRGDPLVQFRIGAGNDGVLQVLWGNGERWHRARLTRPEGPCCLALLVRGGIAHYRGLRLNN